MNNRLLLLVGLIVAGVMSAAAAMAAVTGYQLQLSWFPLAWAQYGVILFGAVLMWRVVAMARAGEQNPKAAIIDKAVEMLPAMLLYLLAGMLQISFGWIKPQLVQLTGFQYDAQLASLDAAIFGTDAWRALSFIMPLQPVLDYVYSLWFPTIILSLFFVFLRRQCEGRDKLIVSYFLLWGVFAPIGQLAMPAAGPIFYERIGLGGRFSELIATVPWGSLNASNYLWAAYTSESSLFASGISAMPSMHVAMAFWIALAYWRTKLTPVASLYFIAVFLGSVLLGWHYFVDGVAGVAGAVICWKVASLPIYKIKERRLGSWQLLPARHK